MPKYGECPAFCGGESLQPIFPPKHVEIKVNSISEHSLSTITFDQIFESLKTMKPATALMEQSEGFGLPFDTRTTETPLQRQGLENQIIFLVW